MFKLALPKWKPRRVGLFQRCRPVTPPNRETPQALKNFVTCSCCTLGYGIDHTKCCDHRWSAELINGR
jgi:hypothetical protein